VGSKQNVRKGSDRPKTHEGGPARRITATQQLERSVNACLLFEKTFYEDGAKIADRIYDTTPKVPSAIAARIAVRARNEMYIRHAPLLIGVAMAASESHRPYVADVLGGEGEPNTPEWKPGIIRRPDELGEFISLYWLFNKERGGRDRAPLAAQAKRGLAKAVLQFDDYQLGKWKGSAKTAVTLRDVLRLVHPIPQSAEQAQWFKGIIDGTLEAPNTWEVALSGGEDKGEAFTRLMEEGNLPAMAFLMNLRNMIEAGVSAKLMSEYADGLRFARVLPHRFITAEKHAPQLSEALERGMLRALEGSPKLPGRTILMIDNSGSMQSSLSGGRYSGLRLFATPSGGRIVRAAGSEATRADAAGALAIHAREICEDVRVFGFSDDAVEIPNRRGFALRDAIMARTVPRGTNFGRAVDVANKIGYDRLIVISDEQAHDSVMNPLQGTRGYVINVAAYENGVGYHPWVSISGFSPNTLRYVMSVEGVIPGAGSDEEENAS